MERKDNPMAGSLRTGIREIVLAALMVATIEGAKIALNALPNIELVTLLITLFSRRFGKRILYVIPVFVLAECLQWGFGLWTFFYSYIWFILAFICLAFRKNNSLLMWCVIDGAFGLFFGMLCAVNYIFIGGVEMAFAWWVAGIPFDIIHCVGNFTLALVLFKPLDKALSRITVP